MGAGNGKPGGRTQVPGNGDSNPQPQGRPFPGWVSTLIGVTVVGVVVAVSICTALVYGRRLEALQRRVDTLELRYSDVEATMRHYVDERLRSFLARQVSSLFISALRFLTNI